jgi:N-acetylglucosamine-6-phosphate deacetylase
MSSLLLKNCRVVSPEIEIPGASVLAEDEFIQRIFLPGEELPQADSVRDLGGRILAPGFVDMHSHGAMGYDVTDAKIEGLTAIAQAKLKEGVTTYIPTTLTLPEDRLTAALKTVALLMAEKNISHSKIPGVHLEGPFINPACTGAQNPAFVRKPDINEVKRLNSIARVLLISFAVEAEGGLEFARGLRAMGITPSCGHSAATHAQFRDAMSAGVRSLTHFCNQMSRLHHRDIGLVGAGLLERGVTVELICDKMHISPEMISLVFKCKSLSEIAIVTDSLAPSWLSDGNYDIGGLPIKVEKGVARLVEGGNLAGSTIKFYDSLRNVRDITGLPLRRLIQTAGFNQAVLLGLPKIGRIEAGYYADLLVLDETTLKPLEVYLNGRKAI